MEGNREVNKRQALNKYCSVISVNVTLLNPPYLTNPLSLDKMRLALRHRLLRQVVFISEYKQEIYFYQSIVLFLTRGHLDCKVLFKIPQTVMVTLSTVVFCIICSEPLGISVSDINFVIHAAHQK